MRRDMSVQRPASNRTRRIVLQPHPVLRVPRSRTDARCGVPRPRQWRTRADRVRPTTLEECAPQHHFRTSSVTSSPWLRHDGSACRRVGFGHATLPVRFRGCACGSTPSQLDHQRNRQARGITRTRSHARTRRRDSGRSRLGPRPANSSAIEARRCCGVRRCRRRDRPRRCTSRRSGRIVPPA